MRYLVLCVYFFILCTVSAFGAVPVGEWGAPSNIGVTVAGTTAYCAVEDGGLDILDVSSPSSPTLLANIEFDGRETIDVTKSGDYVFVASYDDVCIVDVSVPGTPVWVSTADAGPCNQSWVDGDYLYAAATTEGLKIFDISDIANPTLVATYNEAHSSYGIFYESVIVSGGIAYVADGFYGMVVLDVSTPASPSKIAELGLEAFPGDNWPEYIDLNGSYAYIASGDAGLNVVDISNPASPLLLGTVDTNGWAYDVKVLNASYVMVSDSIISNGSRGMYFVDVSTPSAPYISDTFDPGGDPRDFHLVGNYAYISTMGNGLRVWDTSIPCEVGAYTAGDTKGYAQRMRLDGDTLYLSHGVSGLRILDVTNPAAMSLTGSCTATTWMRGLDFQGNYVFRGDFYGQKIEAVDISNPSSPSIVASIDADDRVSYVQVDGNYLYVCEYTTLQIVDISDPTAPAVISSLPTPGSARGCAKYGSYVYVADGGYLTIVDVSDPAAPSQSSAIAMPDQCYYASVKDNVLALATAGGAVFYDLLSDPTNPQQLGSVAGFASTIHANGDFAYVACGGSGFQIINIADPTTPYVIGGQMSGINGYVFDVLSNGSQVFITTWSHGEVKVYNLADVINPISSAERQALIDIYNATNGDNWTNNSGWKTPPLEADGFGPVGSEDSWFGVDLSIDGSTVESLNLANNNLAGSISSLALPNLQTFNCSSNQLTALDVSANTALTELHCDNNQLTALDVSANTALRGLWCGGNQLTTLDVSANTVLQTLWCGGNQLTTLDVSANTALTELKCSFNQLTALDVSANTALTKLYCDNNQLTALGVSANMALTDLDCDNNQLTALDVSANTALTNLNCGSNQLTALDVSANTALQYLYCYNNQLTALDVSANTELTDFHCDANQLTTLDVSANTALQELWCTYNQLIALDVSANAALEILQCYNNQLTDIPDVTGCTGLNEYQCYGNYFNADDCATIAAIEAMGLSTFTYNPQADGYTLDCSGGTATHTITCSAGTGGSINPTGAQVVYDGSSQIVHITPIDHYHIADVLVDGSSVGAVTSHTFSNITADHTIEASFALDTYTLTMSVGSGSGTVDPTAGDHVYNYGTDVQITATPGTGYTFSGWTGDLISNQNPATVTITGDMSIAANFTHATYTLTVDVAEGSGSVNQSGSGTYNYGDTPTVTATPDTGWVFSHWSGDASGSDNPLTVTMDGDKTIHAHFAQASTWSRHYGGANEDRANSIQQTSDGGYVVAGYSRSFTHGGTDFLIYKLDSNGNKVWARNYGGANDDYAESIQQTSDGGYVVAGWSRSFTHGWQDFMIYKLDANGNKVWARNYGGASDDYAYSIQQTTDGGYVVAGYSGSFTHGYSDFLIYKLDTNGNKVWARNYGGTNNDAAWSMQQTSDGGYVMAGTSYSFTHGGLDFLIYKLDSNGNKVWARNYGGVGDDWANSIQPTSDGGYVVAGYSDSFGHGSYDFMIYKLDANGTKVWAKFYGGVGNDRADSIQPTSDGGYVVAGRSYSFTHGGYDFMTYKLDSNGNKVWAKFYGGANDDWARSIQQTSDGGYVVAGKSSSFTHGNDDFMIYKLNASGDK